MNRVELNYSAFILKIFVQLSVLLYFVFEIGKDLLSLWVLIVASFILISSLKQMKLEEEYFKTRCSLIFIEWLLIITLFPFVQYSLYFILMIVLVVTSTTTIENTIIQGIYILIFSFTTILHSIYTNSFSWQQLMSFLLLLLFFISFSYFFRKFEEQQWNLEKLNESLKSYTQKEKEWALEQERNTIARNLHDTVAHQATGLIIQLQKMRMAHELGRDYDVIESMKESERVARSILNDMRQSVRMIAPVELSEAPFDELFAEFSNLTDMKIRSQGVNNIYAIPLSQQADIYGICQEALTNAKRHGEATEVDIEVENKVNQLTLRIRDNGKGLADNWKKGFGLSKMFERVKEAKGEIEIKSGQGVEIVVKWPLGNGEEK